MIICDIFQEYAKYDYIGYIGLVTILYFIYRILCWISWMSVYFGEAKFDFSKYADGGYALISGGAGGIGKECAKHMAQRGINIYLIDFNKELLTETVAEISKNFPKIDIKSKVMDMTKLRNEDEFNKFRDEMNSLKIGILFNNAGIAEYKLFRYTENTHKEITSICDINAVVPALMNNIILPQMVKRKNGLILGMSSASAVEPCSALPLYGSTKSFMMQLSKSLQNAYPEKESGIHFHSFYPHLVKTAMTTKHGGDPVKKLKKYIFPDVSRWFDSAIKTVGAHRGASCGWFWFELIIPTMLLQEKIMDFIVGGKDGQRKLIDKRIKQMQAEGKLKKN